MLSFEGRVAPACGLGDAYGAALSIQRKREGPDSGEGEGKGSKPASGDLHDQIAWWDA